MGVTVEFTIDVSLGETIAVGIAHGVVVLDLCNGRCHLEPMLWGRGHLNSGREKSLVARGFADMKAVKKENPTDLSATYIF